MKAAEDRRLIHDLVAPINGMQPGGHATPHPHGRPSDRWSPSRRCSWRCWGCQFRWSKPPAGVAIQSLVTCTSPVLVTCAPPPRPRDSQSRHHLGSLGRSSSALTAELKTIVSQTGLPTGRAAAPEVDPNHPWPLLGSPDWQSQTGRVWVSFFVA